MRFSTSAVALALVSCVAAADLEIPVIWDKVVPSVHQLSARAAGGVFICTDINFTGDCVSATLPLDTCVPLSSASLANQLSSFGPDDCAVCKGYTNRDCTGSSWSFVYPGDPTGGLGTNNPWNDKIQSIECSALAC